MPMKNPPHPGGFVMRQCIAPLGLTITQAAAALVFKFADFAGANFPDAPLAAVAVRTLGVELGAAQFAGCPIQAILLA